MRRPAVFFDRDNTLIISDGYLGDPTKVTLGVEGSYGQVSWSNNTAITMLSTTKSFIVGGIAHYDPVKNLDFELELLYQGTTTAEPMGYVAGGPGCGTGVSTR